MKISNTIASTLSKSFCHCRGEPTGGAFSRRKKQLAERWATFRGLACVVGWIVLGLFCVAGPANTALGSCGDYLHGRFDLSTNFLGHQLAHQDPAQVPVGACKDGKCGNQMPVDLPARDKVQVEDRSAELNLRRVFADFASGLNGLVVEYSDIVRRIFLEVPVPPPRVI